MQYTITTQKSTPRAFYPPALHTLENLDAARKGAQIVSNSRRVFTILWHGAPGFHTRREFFAPEPAPILSAGARWTQTQREDNASKAAGRPHGSGFRGMRAHMRQCGQNAGAVLAALRQIYASTNPGARLTVELECNGWIIRHDGNHVARLSSFMRPGETMVRVSRSYDYASANPGAPILSGALCALTITNGQEYAANTWQGAHEVSAFPVPESEKRPATLETTIAQ